MTRLMPLVVLVAVAVGVFAIATSGGSSASQTHKAGQAAGYGAPARPAGASAAVSLRSTSLGKILVDGNGRSLYLFEADTANKSNCSGACLSSWPALTSDTTPAASGALTGRFATIAAAGGKRQVTYNGHPLYLYAGDQQAGDTAGEGLKDFGAEWYALSPSGNKIDEG
jgi:predicted lipoprotein with Yx(FWY)xxD motif